MELAVPHNYYEVLGVSPDATEEDIKRAYVKRRRELQQAGRDGELAVLLQAKTVLTDPAARKHYDARLQFGAAAQELHEQAVEAASQEDWSQAVKLFKQVLALVPTAYDVMNELGFALFRDGNIIESMKLYDGLLQSVTDVPAYWLMAGNVYLEASKMAGSHIEGDTFAKNCPACSEEVSGRIGPRVKQATFRCSECNTEFKVIRGNAKDFIERARYMFQQAIALDPKAATPYIRMSFTYIEEGHVDKAIEWAEKAVLSDEKVDINDLDELLMLCDLYVIANQTSLLLSTVDRLLGLSPDPQLPDFLQAVFVSRLRQAWSSVQYKYASMYCAAACRVKENSELQNLLKHLGLLAQCQEEWTRAVGDRLLPYFCKVRFRWLMIENALIESDEDDPSSVVKRVIVEQLRMQATAALQRTSPDELEKGLKYVKTKYPAFYELDKDTIEHILKELRKHGLSTSSGCSTVVLSIPLFLAVLWLLRSVGVDVQTLVHLVVSAMSLGLK